MSETGFSAPYTPDREIRAKDRAFEALRDDRVSERRVIAGPNAADFYRYELLLDGELMSEALVKAVRFFLDRGIAHYSGQGFAGLIGPATVQLSI